MAIQEDDSQSPDDSQLSRDELERQVAELRQENARRKADCRRLESAIRECQRRFRVLLHSLPDKVFHKDRNSVYVACNRNYALDFGLEPEQMVDKTDLDLFPAEIAAKYRLDDQRIMDSGESAEIVEDYVLRSGEERIIRTVKSVLRDEQGHVIGILGIFSDITDQKRSAASLLQARDELERRVEDRTADLRQANVLLEAEVERRRRMEQALRETEQWMQMALDVSHSFAFEWNVPTDRVIRSDSCGHVLGLSGDESRYDTGQRFFQRVHADDRERFLQTVRQVKPSADTYHTEYRVIRGDGATVVLEESARGLFDSEGVLHRLVGVTTDITNRRLAEDALRQSEAKYRALVESAPDAVVMVDRQGRVSFASQRAAVLHGVRHPDELLGSPAADFVAEADRERFTASIASLRSDGIHRNIEYTLLRQDGTSFAAEVSSAIVLDAAGAPESMMAVYQDISQFKRAQARLRATDIGLLAAGEIQAHLLPQEPPRLAGYDIAGHCFPAEETAGDHFDYLWLPDKTLLIVLADVSGHGLGSAIVAAAFSARLRTLTESMCNLRKMAARVNAGLHRETDGEHFVTALLGKLDPATGRLSGLNAGHPDAIVLDARGRVKTRLRSGGPPFAIHPEVKFAATGQVQLGSGDLVLFYTDGLTEAHRRGQPLFGIERSIEIVRAHQHQPAAEIVDALYESACRHVHPEKPTDDITVVVIKTLTDPCHRALPT